MLFDLSSGKRKRVVQVVYAILALLMGGSLVLFGIGSDAPGGILDAVGLGSNSDGGSDSGYEQQIDDAEAKLETDPNNAQALLSLVRYRSLEASAQIERDEATGQITGIPPEARTALEQSVDAWQRYLDTKPANPDTAAALSASGSYQLLGDASGAAEAQRFVAEERKTAESYGQLAFYLYADFKFDEADAAAAKAVELADPSQRAQLKKQYEAIAEQARAEQKRIEQEAEQGGKDAGEEQLTDPFGSLGGSTGVTPTPTP